MLESYHIPVLLHEAIELLDIQPGGLYVDLTFGGGGHSRAILERLGPEGRLVGFDQDAETRANTPDDARFRFVEGNFRFMRGLLRNGAAGGHGETSVSGENFVDGVLADLGVSSHHFDSAARGFSFRADAPLDMRMNRGRKLTAAHVVNSCETSHLIEIFRDYGELDQPHKLAGRIVEARKSAPITTTGELVEVARPLIPRSDENRWLSKLFQALRIEVNGEMEALRMALQQSLKVLKPGGRLVVISYHSLEDRLVKNFFKTGNFEGRAEKDFYGKLTTPWEVITRKPVVPTPEEIACNPRSRSAKLRAASKWNE